MHFPMYRASPLGIALNNCFILSISNYTVYMLLRYGREVNIRLSACQHVCTSAAVDRIYLPEVKTVWNCRKVCV